MQNELIANENLCNPFTFFFMRDVYRVLFHVDAKLVPVLCALTDGGIIRAPTLVWRKRKLLSSALCEYAEIIKKNFLDVGEFFFTHE